MCIDVSELVEMVEGSEGIMGFVGTELDTKVCSKCGKEMLVQFFSKDLSKKNGLASWCKSCVTASRHSKIGLIRKIYGRQKSNSKRRGHEAPRYCLAELIDYLFSSDDFHIYYDLWTDSGYEKDFTPSVDRLEDSVGYIMGNIQVLQWVDNNDRGHRARRRPVIQFDSEGFMVDLFPSGSAAAKKLGLNQRHISDCCRGRRKTTGGFSWEFVQVSTITAKGGDK